MFQRENLRPLSILRNFEVGLEKAKKTKFKKIKISRHALERRNQRSGFNVIGDSCGCSTQVTKAEMISELCSVHRWEFSIRHQAAYGISSQGVWVINCDLTTVITYLRKAHIELSQYLDIKLAA